MIGRGLIDAIFRRVKMEETQAPSALRIKHFSKLPDKALLSAKEVVFLSGRSRTSLWRDVQRGFLARPIKLGPKAMRWTVSDIKSFLEGSK